MTLDLLTYAHMVQAQESIVHAAKPNFVADVAHLQTNTRPRDSMRAVPMQAPGGAHAFLSISFCFLFAVRVACPAP